MVSSVIPPQPWTYCEVAPLLIRVMTSKVYNVLLFPLYIWNQLLRIKFSDLLINEMLTVLNICTKKIQSCWSICLACLYGFYKGEGRSDGTLGMLMFSWLCFSKKKSPFSPPLILVAKSVVNIRSSEAAIKTWYGK